jgi:class 3 adenylate cyclase/tetratricopeptide (TPR) repeat protein
MLTCPSCGTDNTEASKFCNECGTKLENIPVREERKVITALFCDLVGSTALGERLDAEDISLLLRGYQTICRRRIESYGGVVEKFIGDAVVGVFGVPLAHEDDPERAVRAALRIAEDIGASDLDIQVRIGLNTGEALVRLDVDPRSGEGFATGDTLNTAARLEAAAPVMAVAVGKGTYQATQALIAYESLRSVSAKGKAEPVEAWRAVSARSRIGTPERDRTRFVGRELELSTLIQLFDRSRTRSATEFCSIIAEPGLGKSRLVRELARHVDRLPELVTWREGRCLPYGDGISFWALGEIVKAQAGIMETDDQPTITAKLDRAIIEPDPQTRIWMTDRLAPLVGLGTETAPPQQEEAFTAWRRFLEQMATSGPTVLVIEDLHWADPGFVSFLIHLSERTVGLPLFVVVTARPEVEDRHPAWPLNRPMTMLSVPPLADSDVQTLISATLEDASPEITQVVLERAGGSPLFAEQLAVMLTEGTLSISRSPDELMIPANIQALIAARIDTLALGSKRVLMQASVVGKTFWAGAVAALEEHPDLDSTLAELVRREFLRPVMPSTMQGDAEFTFWHALVRDVAYAELTRAERARMHAEIARWMQGTESDPGEAAEIVADHFQLALTFAEATNDADGSGRLREELSSTLVAAGNHALRASFERAVNYFRRASEMIGSGHPLKGQALAGLARALRYVGSTREAAGAYSDALRERRDHDDIGAVAQLAILAAGPLRNAGRSSEATALLEESRAWFTSHNDPGLVAALSEMARHAMTGRQDMTAATQLADKAIAAADRFHVPYPDGALAVRAGGLFSDGDLFGAIVMRQAVEAAVASGDLLSARNHLSNLSVGVSSTQGPIQGLPLLDDAIRFATERGLPAIDLGSHRIEALAEMGRWDDVIVEAPPLLEWATERGDGFVMVVVRTIRQSVLLERGDDPGDVDDLLSMASSVDIERVYCVSLVARARLARGDRAEASSILEQEVRAAGPEEMTFNVLEVVRSCLAAGLPDIARLAVENCVPQNGAQAATRLQAARAAVEESDGDFDAAHAGFRKTASAFERLGMDPARSDSLIGLGRCLLGMGDREGGGAALGLAREISVRLGARPRIAEIDELLSRATGRPA